MAYRRLLYRLPPDREDALVAELWLAGTLGVQSSVDPDGRLRLEAYFPAGFSPPRLDLPADVELVGDEILPDADWLAAWRERARPFLVGGTLFLDPREPGEEPVEVPAGRRLLHLPARAAFGTGSHESTSLALELLERMEVRGRRVLDVGTGTGVLAFAALLFGARSVVGFDVDVAAPVHARDNSALNRLQPRWFAGRLGAIRRHPLFDVALVNVVPEQILPEMPELVPLLRPGAEVVFSGILAERGPQVLEQIQDSGLAERERQVAGEWVAFRVELSGRPPEPSPLPLSRPLPPHLTGRGEKQDSFLEDVSPGSPSSPGEVGREGAGEEGRGGEGPGGGTEHR